MEMFGKGRHFPGPARLIDYSSVPVLDDLVHSSLQQFSYGDLKLFTDDFSDDNFIVRTQFCKVYRGKIPKASINGMEEEEQVVTVKIWADSVDWPGYSDESRRVNFAGTFERCKDEVKLLTNEALNVHPNLVKLMGWCCEIENENLGVVYNLNSFDTLRNLIPGELLKWADRIKIALGLASLLEALHNHQPRCLVLNISAAHIMIDQDCNPVLLEFGLLCSKVDSERLFFPFGAYGYPDIYLAPWGWGEWTDVFGFGVVLMEMLTKRTVDDGVKDFKVKRPRDFPFYSAESTYKSLREAKWEVPRCLLVEKSFTEDAEFNNHDEDLVTMLALECVIWSHPPRPTMSKVISRLKCLYLLGGSDSDKVMIVEGSIGKKMKKMLFRAFRRKILKKTPG